jgi:tRNA (guanine37-N1)-methyltransferase
VVPEVLVSGNHKKIDEWRRSTAIATTVKERFDWIRTQPLGGKDLTDVAAQIPPHYAVLMHDQVLIGKVDPQPGTTSVTTMDLHDIARSSATYGIKKLFIVTPLTDQKRQLEVFFEFWHTSKGQEYNKDRFEAMSLVQVCDSMTDVLMAIASENNNQEAVMVATSAKEHVETVSIDYTDQKKVWNGQQPVLIVFGTGQGLTNDLVARCDYVLKPVRGFTTYNHLSVRAAVAIVFDRWLGLHG